MLPARPPGADVQRGRRTTLTVGWVAPTGGAASYDVDRAPASSGPWAQIASGVAALSYADSALIASTVYSYRVRATNAEGKDGGSSSVASVTTLAGP